MPQDSGGPNEPQDAQSLEQWKAQIEANLEVWKYERTQSLLWDKGAFDFAALALRSVILINGGAAVALLAFLAHLWTTEGRDADVIAPVFASLSEFVIGIAAGVAACGVGYLAAYFSSGALQMDPDQYKRLRPTFVWIGSLCHNRFCYICGLLFSPLLVGRVGGRAGAHGREHRWLRTTLEFGFLKLATSQI